jgi:hypothetical protein
MDSVIESCLLGKKATIHSRIQRFGPQTTSSICRGLNTEWTEADFPKVEAELERLAEELEIAKTERGWAIDVGALILRMKDAIHAAISRNGPMSTSSITQGILNLNKSESSQVQAELQRLAEDLGIAETERGWVLDTSILAPEQKRRYTLESHRIQVAQKVAYEMGLEGKPDVAWRALSRRVAEITGEKIHEAWFAPSGRGAHFREHIEAAFADGVAERNRKIEQVASELGEIVDEVVGATNGNGHHLDEEPTDEDLSLVEEVAKLETAIEEYQDRIRALEAQLAAMAWVGGEAEEYQNKIAALEAQLAASAPAQVQTPQQDSQGTLEDILAALQIQLEDASSKAEAAAKAVELAQEQAELAELGVDQARQRLQAALEAVNTLQALKEGE